MPKYWCFWTVVLEKTLKSPLDCKEIKPVNPKGNQSWIFIGRTNAEPPILWPRDAKNWLIGKDPDAGKAQNEMVGWHHWLDGHEFEQAPGVGDGQGSLACCSPWVCRVRRDWATELNWLRQICRPQTRNRNQLHSWMFPTLAASSLQAAQRSQLTINEHVTQIKIKLWWFMSLTLWDYWILYCNLAYPDLNTLDLEIHCKIM